MTPARFPREGHCKIYLETMAAIAPAHRCLVVFMALPPRTLTLCDLACSTVSSPSNVTFSEFSSPFSTAHTFGSPTNLPPPKLTDKNQPPGAAETLLRRRKFPEPTAELAAEWEANDIFRARESRDMRPFSGKQIELEDTRSESESHCMEAGNGAFHFALIAGHSRLPTSSS
ncbi:hypothetical protein G2W53_030936 [Senna tora]|uniref:Uncharacterized protein n=1 Tax=Senna tora TaxID=362788 RepID=A0A834WC14_9FABA|nr:hypothetical protein G2W53_030936 [Senna tora]